MKILSSIKAIAKKILKKDILYPENRDLISLFSAYSKGYIFGSAPSINKLDLSKLEKDALIISMGNFHEHPDIEAIKPHIHIFAASHPPITKNVIRNWFSRAEEVLPMSTVVLVEERDFELAKSIYKSRKLYRYAYGGDFPIDFTKRVISPSSVAIIGIQFGNYIGLKELNLLGIDHDWQTTEGYGHFYDHSKPSLEFYLKEEGLIDGFPSYTGRQPKERLYRFYDMYKQYEMMKSGELNHNFEIFNADPYSGFDVFEKKEMSSLRK